ncbi:MAG: hypothetical protein PHF00_09365, partial [Elusimicrobia bacterium]|nr:hypothetical protein [Elusimicrobiota bacterium]
MPSKIVVKKSLACLLTASLLWMSLPMSAFAAANTARPGGTQPQSSAQVRTGAWIRHFENNLQLFGALGISESLAPSLLNVMSRASLAPDAIENLTVAEQARAVRTAVVQQTA